MDFAREQRNPGKHLPGIIFVIVLHLLIVYALLNGLGVRAVKLIKGSLDANLIEEFKKPPAEAPPPAPKFERPPPEFIPPPDITIAVQAPVTNTITQVTHKEPPVVHQPVRTAAVIDAKRSCPQPEYPAASRRLEEKGSVILKFLIDVDGRVLDSKVETSSGFERLDEAAREALSRCRFKPATTDGKAEQSWSILKYTWKLD